MNNNNVFMMSMPITRKRGESHMDIPWS